MKPTITLNDEARPHIRGQTVLALLEELDPRLPMVVVKLNGAYVPRAQWERRELREGDEVRVVHIIAGG